MAKKKKTKKSAVGRQKTTPPPPPPSAPATPGAGSLRLRYQSLISIFLLVAGICVLYPELVFQDKVFQASDVEAAASFAAPIKQAMKEKNVYPLWNPYLFSGMPSYGSLSYNPDVYPLTRLTAFLINYLKFPGFTWLLFHVWMLGLGVWLLLMSRGVHFLIAAGAGVLMMWMPNHVAVGVNGHGSQACAVGYIPFALFFWDRLWRGKGVLLNAAALVILLGFQFLRAHLQISYYTFALLALHLIFFGTLRIRDGFRGAGAPDEGAVFGFLRGAYSGGRASKRRAALMEVAGAVVLLAVVVLGALLVASVLFGPVHDYAKYSIRGASEGGGLDYDYATSWSLHPAESLTFIIPFSFGFGKHFYYGHMPFTDYPNYLGIVIVIFALFAAFRVKTRFVRFLLFVVVVSTFVAFGKYLPVLYSPLFNFAPYFNKFRVPVMVLIVQQLAVVLLFGLGLSAVLRSDPTEGRKKALWALAAASMVFLIVAVTYNYWTDGFSQSIAKNIRNVRSAREQLEVASMVGGLLFKDLVKFSLLLVITSSLLVLFFRRLLSPRAFVVLILGTAMVDIFMVDRHIVHPEKLFRAEQLRIVRERSERDRFLQRDGLIDFLQKDSGYYRVLPIYHPSAPLYRDFATNRYMNFSIGSVGGYHPAKLSIYEEFIRALDGSLQRGDFRMIDMLNVRYLIAANPLGESAAFRLVWRGRNYRGEEKYVYENLRALPRVYFVDRFEVASGDDALRRIVSDRSFDVAESVLLEKAPAVVPESDAGARATITEYGANEIRIDAALPSPAIMVVSEVFYPRWRVSVDGSPGEVIRANHILRAVALPAGDHEIVFRYDQTLLSRSKKRSLATFLGAVVTLIAGVILDFRGRRKWKHSS